MKIFEPGLYHIYNRGNNRQPVFFNEKDYQYFIELCDKYIVPRSEILAWCLLPNHFHFLLEINEKSLDRIQWGGNQMPAITNGFQLLQSNYAKMINKQRNHSGSLFQQKTKAKILETLDYANTAFSYIHQNPVKAGFVKEMQDWEYSSYREYCRLKTSPLSDVNLGMNTLRVSEKDFENGEIISLQEEELTGIF